MIWFCIFVVCLAEAETRIRIFLLGKEVARLQGRLIFEAKVREADITFIEDYFDRCGMRPIGPRVHCGTVWCQRPEGHAGDCK